MSRTLENLIEIMSPICFKIVVLFHKRLPNSFLTQIFLQLVTLEKEYMKFDVGRIVNLASFEFFIGTQAWLLYFFSKLDFSLVGGTVKGVYESKSGKEDGGQGE